jgi:hypothetical protein
MDLGLPIIFDPAFFNSLHTLLVNAIQRARTLSTGSGKEVELEVRLGLPKALDRKNGRWSFDSAVGQPMFDALKAKLDAQITPVKSNSTVLIRSYDQHTKIRKITTIQEVNPSGVVFQYKKDIDSVDRLFLSSTVAPQKAGNATPITSPPDT